MDEFSIAQLFRWGNAEALRERLAPLPEAERAKAVKSLRPIAREMMASVAFEVNGGWDGPLSTGHDRCAAMVLYSTADSVMRKVPEVWEFIEQDMPILFERDLSRILTAWGELFLKNPKNHDRVGSMLRAAQWWRSEVPVRMPVTEGTVLLFLTGWANGSAIFEWLSSDSALAYRLIRAAFEIPGRKGASLEQADGAMLHAESIGGFVIPALIHSGVLLQSEVIDWCAKAIDSPERTQYDKSWFRRLKKYLEVTPIATLPDAPERWWLSASEQLIAIARDTRAGIERPEIAGRPDIQAVLPLALLLEQSDWGSFMMGIESFHLAGESDVISESIDALRKLELPEAAELVAEASDHWKLGHEPALDHDEWPDDAVYHRDEELDDRWYGMRGELNARFETLRQRLPEIL